MDDNLKLETSVAYECEGDIESANKEGEAQLNEADAGISQPLYGDSDVVQTSNAAAGVPEESIDVENITQGPQRQIEERLADDYLLLSEEIPGRFGGFSDVPVAVVESAVKENLSLLDAYLRFEHREAIRTAAAQRKQAETAARSAGSLGSEKNAPDFLLQSFEQAFNNALR